MTSITGPRPAYTPSPWLAPPRLHEEDTAPAHAGVSYDSEDYAMLNRPIETDRHARRIERYLAPRRSQRLLEIGSGRGWLAQRMQERFPSTWAVDVNPRSIAHGVAANMAVMDAVALRYADSQFDHVWSFHAIEHIADAESAIREMYRVLVPGGRALLVYPAEPIRGLYAMPGAWIGFGNPFLARQLHLHRFTPTRIRTIGERCGFRHVASALDLLLTPQFISVLERPRLGT